MKYLSCASLQLETTNIGNKWANINVTRYALAEPSNGESPDKW